LQARDLKPFSAARILALGKVVPPQKVRSGFQEPCAVALVGVAPQTLFLCPLDPSDLIGASLAAEHAGEIGRLRNFFFVEKFSFFHEVVILA